MERHKDVEPHVSGNPSDSCLLAILATLPEPDAEAFSRAKYTDNRKNTSTADISMANMNTNLVMHRGPGRNFFGMRVPANEDPIWPPQDSCRTGGYSDSILAHVRCGDMCSQWAGR